MSSPFLSVKITSTWSLNLSICTWRISLSMGPGRPTPVDFSSRVANRSISPGDLVNCLIAPVSRHHSFSIFDKVIGVLSIVCIKKSFGVEARGRLWAVTCYEDTVSMALKFRIVV